MEGNVSTASTTFCFGAIMISWYILNCEWCCKLIQCRSFPFSCLIHLKLNAARWRSHAFQPLSHLPGCSQAALSPHAQWSSQKLLPASRLDCSIRFDTCRHVRHFPYPLETGIHVYVFLRVWIVGTMYASRLHRIDKSHKSMVARRSAAAWIGGDFWLWCCSCLRCHTPVLLTLAWHTAWDCHPSNSSVLPILHSIEALYSWRMYGILRSGRWCVWFAGSRRMSPDRVIAAA